MFAIYHTLAECGWSASSSLTCMSMTSAGLCTSSFCKIPWIRCTGLQVRHGLWTHQVLLGNLVRKFAIRYILQTLSNAAVGYFHSNSLLSSRSLASSMLAIRGSTPKCYRGYEHQSFEKHSGVIKSSVSSLNIVLYYMVSWYLPLSIGPAVIIARTATWTPLSYLEKVQLLSDYAKTTL